jgi:hypothetical protein
METRRIEKRCLHKGIWVALALFLLIGLSNSSVFASVRDSLLKQSSAVITPPSVVLQNGTMGACTVYANGTSAAVSAMAMQTLYAHQETTTIGGSTYNVSKLVSADASGTTLLADAGLPGRKLMGKFVYQLTGVTSIPASSWAIYYRVWASTKKIVAHANIDILARMSNGTIRTSIATMVANSSDLTSTGWSTLTGTYLWSVYTVTDQTDYLEIDYYIDVVTAANSNYVYLRIDDNTLALADQTRTANVYLPWTYDYVLKANNTGTDSWQIRLKKYSDSGISRLQNCTIFFHNSTGANISQIQVENGAYVTQTGSWCELSSSTTTYIAMTVQTNSTGTSYIDVYLEIRLPATTTYTRYIISFVVA